MTHYLALDIETTGPSIIDCKLVALGACVVSVKDVCVVDDACKFRALMPLPDLRDTDSWQPRCFKQFWTNAGRSNDGRTPLQLIQELIKKHGTESECDAMQRFVLWAHAMFERFPSLVVITDTAAFDTTWVNFSLARWTYVSSLTHLRGEDKYQPVRDVSSFHAGVARQTPAQGLWGAEKAALKALGIDAFPPHVEDQQHDHDPLNDAMAIGLQAAFIANRVEALYASKKRVLDE